MNPTAPGSKPVKHRNREESTRRILQAGLEAFSELGYDAATTKLIASRAGLNESLLHRYYKSKNGLLLAIMAQAHKALKEEPLYPAAKTPAAEIYLFLAQTLELELVNEKFLRVVVSRSLVDPEFSAMIRSAVPDPYNSLFARRLTDFQRQGLIRKNVHIPSLVQAIMALGFQVGFFERVAHGRSNDDCRRIFKAFSDNLCQGLCPAKP